MSQDQNAGRIHHIQIDNSSCESVEQFKYTEQPQRIKIVFSRKLRGEWSQGMFAIIRRWFLFFQSAIQKYKPEDTQNYNFASILYWCETWSLTLREKSRLRFFENRVFRRLFGPTRYEVTGEWRNLHNEELNDLYCSPNIIRWSNQGEWKRWGM